MYRSLLSCLLFLLLLGSCKPKHTESVKRPKLVIGIVVDQMRWDYLYRYYDRYSDGGFKRLLRKGFSCDNTMIPYLPAFTAVGHSCVFTGSVPAFSGIAGNDWVEQSTGQRVYCTDDSTVKGVGVQEPESKEGKMSPRNMLVSSITDEMMMADNFRSKVVGISLKDRAAILPAGQMRRLDDVLADNALNLGVERFYRFLAVAECECLLTFGY